MKLVLHYCFFASILLYLTTCKKEEILTDNIETPNLTPSWAFPLVSATLNLSDIEQQFDDDGLIYNNSSKLFEYVYNNITEEFPISDYISIPNSSITRNFPIPAAFSSTPVGNNFSFQQSTSQTISFSNGELLDSISFLGGSITINLLSNLSHPSSTTITFPYLRQNGIPLSQTMNLAGAVGNQITVNLAGYTLDLTRNGTTNNEIEVNLDFVLTRTSSGVSGNESIDFTANFDLSQYDGVWGYFGQYSQAMSVDSFSIDLFEDLDGGNIHFADPRIEFNFFNTSGIPLEVQLNSITAPGNTINPNLGGTGVNTVQLIPAANNFSDTGRYLHTIDNNNTTPTLSTFLDEEPKSIVYSFRSLSNPSGINQNFANNQSKIWGDIKTIIPFYGYADNFLLIDTTEFILKDYIEDDTTEEISVDDAEKIIMRLIAKNGFPIEAEAQIYFADINNVVIDSLFDATTNRTLIQPGYIDFSLPSTDPNYLKVIEKTEFITDIEISRAKLKRLLNQDTERIIYRVRVYTNQASNQQDIKFYPEYEIDLKLSMKIDMNIDVN